MRQKIFFLSVLLCPLFTINGFSQNKTSGTVKDNHGNAIVGANVYWLSNHQGTTSDTEGKFSLNLNKDNPTLIASFVGYQNDTIPIQSGKEAHFTLQESLTLNAFDVVHRKKSNSISSISAIKVESFGEEELSKAACCNLSESFETTPSVDVSFTDAITGTRQIQMLGLAGPYTQVSRENIPSIRGLNAGNGMDFVPGTWIKSIQLSKGAGSVVNGFESITGAINYCLQDPVDMDLFYLNAYANEGGRLELNSHARLSGGKNWKGVLLLHAKNNSIKNDRNKDGFLDNPLSQTYIALNRWKYTKKENQYIEFAVKGISSNSIGGETHFVPKRDLGKNTYWGMQLKTERIEAWSKMGFVNPEKPWESIALQLSGSKHNQQTYFGTRPYNAKQSSLYGNLIYQGILSNTNHVYKLGASYQLDDYNETVDSVQYTRLESVPGIYGEYTYKMDEKYSVVLGLRGDYHNYYGAFASPRLHAKWMPLPATVFRISGGRGLKTANIFSENMGFMASNRRIIIESENPNNPYGLKPEIAWNYGFNWVQSFKNNHKEGRLAIDLYHTFFENQVIIDLDESSSGVVFRTLKNSSSALSAQAQLDYEWFESFDVRVAYRYFDVKAIYDGKKMQRPLLSAHRAFINLAYGTKSNWKLDATLNWNGEKRIPFTDDKPEEYRVDNFSKSYFLLNAQISKKWNDRFEVYLGGENILSFKQANPIIASEAPFGENFDASLIWAPIFGRMIYGGIKFRIP